MPAHKFGTQVTLHLAGSISRNRIVKRIALVTPKFLRWKKRGERVQKYISTGITADRIIGELSATRADYDT